MKRVLYIAGVLLVGLLLVGGMLVATLTSDKVETAAVQLATAELSHALGTHASVGAVEYDFPARLTIRDIYIEDQQQDTLAYIGTLSARFSPLALGHNEIRFSHVRLQDVVADVHRLPDSTWNYQFLADAFRQEQKEQRDPMRSLIAVKDVQLDNIRFRYEEYEANLSHAEMDLHQLSEQVLDAEISKLALQITNHKSQITNHKSPFTVEDLKAHVILNDTLLSVPTLSAQLPNSKLDMSGVEVRFPAGDTLYLSRSAHDITFALGFNEAQVVPSDLALFMPKMQGLTRPIKLSGALNGTLDSLAFNDLEVRYNNRPVLVGNVTAVGLPDLSNPYIRANLTDLHTNAVRIQDFLSRLNGRPITLPKAIHRLGDIHYRGLAQGHLHDITLHGAFRTALGTISTDGSFQSDSLFEHMAYDARVVGRNFRLGRMLDKPQLKTVTLDVSSNGTIDNGDLVGDIKAYVREFTYNDYTYADLHIDGQIQPHRYQGSFSIDDPHLSMAFDGVVNIHEQDPEMNFNLRCRHFDTAPLVDAKHSSLRSPLATSFNLAVDLNGSKVDEISGYLVLDSLLLATAQDSAFMQQLTFLVSAEEDNAKALTLKSDFVSGQMDGTFRYADIAPAFQALMNTYLPAVVPAPKQKWQPVSFNLQIDGHHLASIQRLFMTPVTVSDGVSLRAQADLSPFNSHLSPFTFHLSVPSLSAGKADLQDINLALHTPDDQLALDFSLSADNMRTSLTAQAFRDTLLTHISFASSVTKPVGDIDETLSLKEQQKILVKEQRAGEYGGDLDFVTHFDRYKKKPLIDIHCMPGEITLRDSLYTLGESRLTYCEADTVLTIDHFLFEGAGQHIYANGIGSSRASDTLAIDLKKLDASYIVPFLLPQRTIMFNGLLTGRAGVSSLFKKPTVDTQIHIDSMGLNNCIFGDAEVDLHIKDSLAFHADVYRYLTTNDQSPITNHQSPMVALDGSAQFTGRGDWRLDMMADSVPLEFVNHWTYTVLNDLDGFGSGHIVVGGWKDFTYVLLRAQAQNAHLTLPWTGARYTIPADTIVMDTTSIQFPNVHAFDREGNPVLVNGAVYHQMFEDFVLDLHVDADDALVFDTDKSGEMLRGEVYATGHVDVTGHESDIIVSANARTSRNSRFRLSLDTSSSAYESSFVHFLTAGDTAIHVELEDTTHHTIETLRPERCMVKLNIDINPQLLFQLVLGERNGDMIEGRGTGALSLTYDTYTNDVSLLGTYDIEQGKLDYTVANVIRKNFTVGSGSKIVFSGDPENPQLDVIAKYKVVANLKDLLGSETEQLGTSRNNIPVLTCIHMTGTLNNPILSFALEFPQSDQAIQQQVQQIINTDEMLMRQVIYLLVFGRFFTPEYMSNASYATLNSTYSLLSSTVSSQINAWLSRLTNMLTLGVAIRADGDGENSSQEYEAQFQLQPVDRLVINGNVGYRYNDISNQPFFGDLDVEVLLTEDGQLRLKGYTHMVDKYSLRQATTIQGVGLVWKIDF